MAVFPKIRRTLARKTPQIMTTPVMKEQSTPIITLCSSESHANLAQSFELHQKSGSSKPWAMPKSNEGTAKVPADYKSIINRYNKAHEAAHVKIDEITCFLHITSRTSRLEAWKAELGKLNVQMMEEEMHAALLRRSRWQYKADSAEAVVIEKLLSQGEFRRSYFAGKAALLEGKRKRRVEYWEWEDLEADRVFGMRCLKEVPGEEALAEEDLQW